MDAVKAVQAQLPGLPVSYWTVAAGLVGLYVLSKTVYRLLLHPLRKFPGPKLAAWTYWYEMYYDVFLGGQYEFQIKKLHQQYGPIVRINPEELHVSEPSFYAVLYTPGPNQENGFRVPKRHKWLRFVRLFGHQDQAFFTTADHDLHKLRRGAVERYFNPANVKKVEALLREKVEIVCQRFTEEGAKGEGVPIKLGMTCLATDIISAYAMGKSYNYLYTDDFFPEWHDIWSNVGRISVLFKPWPWLFNIVDNIPEWCAKRIDKGMAASASTKREAREMILHIKDQRDKGIWKRGEHPTVFHEALNSDLPETEKTADRLQGDGMVIIGAATETMAAVLATTIVHIIANPDVMAKLKAELKEAMPDPYDLAPLTELEKLPYLTGVNREGLRTGFGVVTRLQRISEAPLQFQEWSIPAGTPVSMSSSMMHTDPTIFPNPEKFDPERWADPEESARLYKYMVSFSKGPRQCLGINLAYAELYLTIAALFRRFDMELCDTTEDDVELAADWFVPKFKRDLKEVKAYIRLAPDART
ncbi:cytochrome P450 [Lineolata rhizophorae]|uniref:Cytochrome P450 n=1 Tax=Lineolata rhizophorae TaxID=578093 RepID=A0A6A6PF61_9PEZI|nr:cytochrome P450 [Lineolata rhizophorae]